MNARPFSTRRSGNVLHVVLDTPGCAVNIFSHQAAVQLLDILGHIDDDVKAVVLASAKQGSFVNGVGLMLAGAVTKPEDVARLTGTIRMAYRALEELSVPTIAAIRGNCYGCGVELSLRCRHRVAADGYDTHFFMTEIAEYLFIPTFGGTQKLPRLLGLENATDFLLWGRRWSAPVAEARGLVNACIPDDDFDRSIEQIAADLARGVTSPLLREAQPPECDPSRVGSNTRERIRRLPPAYQEVYSACYELLERGSARKADDSDYESEMLAAGRSVMAPISKAALSFFFIRQVCEHVCLRGAEANESSLVHCDGQDVGSRFFRTEFERRRVRGVKLWDGSPGAPGAAEPADLLRIVPYGTLSSPSASDAGTSAALATNLEVAPAGLPGGVVLYAPFWPRGILFAEVACGRASGNAPGEQQRVSGQRLFALLTKAGIVSVITRPCPTFLTNALLGAYLAPQVAFLERGGAPRDLAMTLLGLGFARLPGDWLVHSDADRISSLLAGGPDPGEPRTRTREDAIARLPGARESEGGKSFAPLSAALLASLLACALRSLETGCAAHPSVIDVAARELLDFPLGLGSLCRHLSGARARELLGSEAALAPLVSIETVTRVKEYAHHGQDFYR